MDIITEEKDESLIFEPPKNNKNMNNNKMNNNVGKTLQMSQREVNLSQYSSLINSTVNYPSMNEKSNKNVNFGFTHGEAFKVPYPVSKKKESKLGSFITDNEISYNPVEESQSNLIRFVPEGVSKNNTNINKNNKEKNKKEALMYKWIKKWKRKRIL